MRLWLTAFLLSVLILAGLNSEPSGIRQSGVFSSDPATPYVHYFPQGPEEGRVLVVHGLDASKEVMNLLCLALSDAGFHVYAMDMPGHGDSHTGFNPVLARKAINDALDFLGPDTIAIGHSLGGSLLLDLADSRSYPALVLLSPAPTPVEKIHADRMLVLTGQFELPRIQVFVPQLEITGAEGVELRQMPWSGHAGYLLQPRAIHDIVEWLGGNPSLVQTNHRVHLLLIEILSASAIAALWLRGQPITAEQIHLPSRVVSYVAACTVALLSSGVGVLLSGLRLFSTDYLVSFLLIAGLTLALLHFRRLPRDFSQFHGGVFAAAYVLAVFVFIGSSLVHVTPSGGRLWIFIAISIAVFPLSLVDEVLLRPLRPWWKSAAAAALTRILLGAFVITGVLTLNRSDAFLILITHFVVLLWIALWIIGELVRRRTQDPVATAVFTALVQAWIFAAIFVQT